MRQKLQSCHAEWPYLIRLFCLHCSRWEGQALCSRLVFLYLNEKNWPVYLPAVFFVFDSSNFWKTFSELKCCIKAASSKVCLIVSKIWWIATNYWKTPAKKCIYRTMIFADPIKRHSISDLIYWLNLYDLSEKELFFPTC